MNNQPEPVYPFELEANLSAWPCMPGFVPIFHVVTNGPDQIIGWVEFDRNNPKARYFA